MKTRILHLITQLPTGGAEYLLASIVRHLDSERYESFVCCIQARGEVAAQLEARGVPVFCLERTGKRLSIVTLMALAKLMRQLKIDLVHCHLYHANLYGRLAARLIGIPAIATVHNVYVRKKWHRSLLNRWLSRSRGAVIAVSAEARRDVIEYDNVSPEKVILLTNGIDLDRINTPLSVAEAKERLGFSKQDLIIGCVGRLEEQKGHINALLAFKQVLELTPSQANFSLKLVIVGEGRLRQTLEASIQSMEMMDKVILLGGRNDIADILRSFDIYVMPSLWEGLSLAMLEAMAAGLPVIISDVGGAKEVLADNEFGIRVPPGDIQGLVVAMTTLLSDSGQRNRLSAAARQRVREHYDLRDRIMKLQTVYDELCHVN